MKNIERQQITESEITFSIVKQQNCKQVTIIKDYITSKLNQYPHQRLSSMSLFTIKFLVNCETKFGQVVYICGNTPELGNWNPVNAMRLYTDATLYPKWDPYKTISVREGNKLLFKLCILNQDKNIRWESIQGNREIFATENLLIEFTAHFQEITINPITQEVVKPPRKKTCDILNELQSDGSSSKEYWKQFMEEEEESVLYITLTTQMRRIVEYQTQFFLRLYELNRQYSSQEFDKNLQQKIERTKQIIHQTSNFYCIMENTQNEELISFLGQDSYLIKFIEFNAYSIHNNLVPIFFHLESLKQNMENQSCLEVFDNIARIVHAENILLSQKQKKIEYYISVKLTWDPTRQLIEHFTRRKVALVLIESQQILEAFLELIISLNYQYFTQDFTEITILLNHMSTMKIKLILQNDPKFKSPSALNKKQRIQHQNQYFDSIKKTILQNHNKSFVGYSKENFIQSIKEDETFVGLVNHRKNIMILNAQKIQDFTSKLLTQIIALSSKPNFQVYIILEKMSIDIKTKFPASKNNKLVVLSKSGTLYANEQTFIDLFQNLNLQKNKFAETMSKIQNSIILGLKSKQTSSTNQMIFQFKKGHVGKIGSQILKSKINQNNENSLHKLILERKEADKFSVKPFCLTEQFFLKAIFQNLSKYVHEDRSLVMIVNLKNDNNFIYKCNTLFHSIFNHKNSVKMRNIQILSQNETQYLGTVGEQTISMSYLEAQLEFICEHFLAGSHIKSYNLNILSPHRSRRSFANKLKAKQYSYENF